MQSIVRPTESESILPKANEISCMEHINIHIEKTKPRYYVVLLPHWCKQMSIIDNYNHKGLSILVSYISHLIKLSSFLLYCFCKIL